METLAANKSKIFHRNFRNWQDIKFIETLPTSKRDSSKLRQLTREIRQNFGNRLNKKFIEPLAAKKSKSSKLCYGFVLISTSARYGIRNMRLGSKYSLYCQWSAVSTKNKRYVT